MAWDRWNELTCLGCGYTFNVRLRNEDAFSMDEQFPCCVTCEVNNYVDWVGDEIWHCEDCEEEWSENGCTGCSCEDNDEEDQCGECC